MPDKPDQKPGGPDSHIPLHLWYLTGGTGPRPTWAVYLSRAQARVERARDEDAYKAARKEAAKEAKLRPLEFKRQWGGGLLDRILHPEQERERFGRWRQEQGRGGNAGQIPTGQEGEQQEGEGEGNEEEEETKQVEEEKQEEEKHEEQVQGHGVTPPGATNSPDPGDNDKPPEQVIKAAAPETDIRDETSIPTRPVSAAGDVNRAKSPQHKAGRDIHQS